MCCADNRDVSTVLVVDDKPIVRGVVVRYLERDGYRTLEAASGHEAQHLFEREPTSLVVLDVMLPGIDGLEVCRWIRARSDLPIVMLTARGVVAVGGSAQIAVLLVGGELYPGGSGGVRVCLTAEQQADGWLVDGGDPHDDVRDPRGVAQRAPGRAVHRRGGTDGLLVGRADLGHGHR